MKQSVSADKGYESAPDIPVQGYYSDQNLQINPAIQQGTIQQQAIQQGNK